VLPAAGDGGGRRLQAPSVERVWHLLPTATLNRTSVVQPPHTAIQGSVTGEQQRNAQRHIRQGPGELLPWALTAPVAWLDDSVNVAQVYSRAVLAGWMTACESMSAPRTVPAAGCMQYTIQGRPASCSAGDAATSQSVMLQASVLLPMWLT
jgi:hypothetical protein